jgi:hypothetical protein
VRRLLLLGCCLLAVVGASCGRASASRAPAVRDLHSLAELRTAFDAHRGVPRLVVLVSPT